MTLSAIAHPAAEEGSGRQPVSRRSPADDLKALSAEFRQIEDTVRNPLLLIADFSRYLTQLRAHCGDTRLPAGTIATLLDAHHWPTLAVGETLDDFIESLSRIARKAKERDERTPLRAWMGNYDQR